MFYLAFLSSWLFFGLLHSLLATHWFKQLAQSWLGSLFPYYRLLYNFISLLTLLPILVLYAQLPAVYLWPPGGWSFYAGGLLTLTGLVISVLVLRTYDLQAFAGWPLHPQPAGADTLQTGGLLRFVRHPLYVGILLILAGGLLIRPSRASLLFFLAALFYIRIGIYFEERKLIRAFGDQYRAYRRRVPMLIPFRWGR